MSLNIISLQVVYDEGFIMQARNLQELQSALIGFTKASMDVLKEAQKAVDSMLKTVHEQNAALLALHTKTPMSSANTTTESHHVLDDLNHSTRKLFNINDAMQHVQASLNMLIASSQQQTTPPSQQLLDGKLKECLKLNSQLHVQIASLALISGRSHHLSIDQKIADELTRNLGDIILLNQKIRKDLSAETGLEKNADHTIHKPAKNRPGSL